MSREQGGMEGEEDRGRLTVPNGRLIAIAGSNVEKWDGGRKEELSSSSSLGWTQPSQQSMQRGNSHVCGESSQLHGDAAASEGIRRCEESVVPKCPIQCSSLGCTQVPQHARSIQRENSFVSQVSVLKCDGLRSEEEELGVQSIAQQTAGIKALEERKKGPAKEGNGFLEQSKDFHPQLPKASNNHTSHVPMMSEQLTVNGSADIEKEREKLLQENEMLKVEKTSLQSIVAKLQQERSHEETNQWREKYEQLIIDMETAKETESRRVKQLESQLYSSQEASRGVAELEGTLIEQDTRLQEYYTHMEEQEKTLASMQGLEVELKRANEENNQLKAEIEGYTNSQKKHAEQQESYCRDLALRTGEVKEAQRQYAECYRRLQQVEGELTLVKNKLKEESEKLQAQCTTHYSLATWYRDAQAQIKVLEEEKARLMQHKGGLQKEYEQLNSRLVIMAKQLKVYESERDHVLSEANTQKQSLQKEINSLTAKSQESQEAMRKMASELEMTSRRENKEHSRSLQLEAELKRCYKHIEGQKKALVEEKFKNQMELMNRRIAVLEKDKELVANGGPIHFQRSISQRVPQEHLPPHPPRLSHTSPQPMAPEDQGVCPICGRRDFKSVEELQSHSAKCTDYEH